MRDQEEFEHHLILIKYLGMIFIWFVILYKSKNKLSFGEFYGF